MYPRLRTHHSSYLQNLPVVIDHLAIGFYGQDVDDLEGWVTQGEEPSQSQCLPMPEVAHSQALELIHRVAGQMHFDPTTLLNGVPVEFEVRRSFLLPLLQNTIAQLDTGFGVQVLLFEAEESLNRDYELNVNFYSLQLSVGLDLTDSTLYHYYCFNQTLSSYI